MRAPVYPTKEFLVGNAADRFTDGRLTDQSTERRLAPWLKGFVEWAVVQPSL